MDFIQVSWQFIILNMSTAKADLGRLLAPPRPPRAELQQQRRTENGLPGKVLCTTNRAHCQKPVSVQQTQKMDRLQRSSAPYVKPKTAKDTSSFGKMSTVLKEMTSRRDVRFNQKELTNENSEATIHYLTQYLNQLILDNCKLKINLGEREKDVVWLQQELLRKEEETQLVKQSKSQIADSIRRISGYNQSYIDELRRKNDEIDELKRKLLEAPYRYSDKNDDSDTDEASNTRARPRYRQIREEIMGKRDANLSTVSSSSVLESAKKYVANVRSGVGHTIGYGSISGGLAIKKF